MGCSPATQKPRTSGFLAVSVVCLRNRWVLSGDVILNCPFPSIRGCSTSTPIKFCEVNPREQSLRFGATCIILALLRATCKSGQILILISSKEALTNVMFLIYVILLKEKLLPALSGGMLCWLDCLSSFEPRFQKTSADFLILLIPELSKGKFLCPNSFHTVWLDYERMRLDWNRSSEKFSDSAMNRGGESDL